MLEREQQLIAKYGPDAAKKMRRHGFSGLSIEERAKRVGLSTEYDIIYRNFSRNIHNTDYMEHLAERGAMSKERWQHYQDVRNDTALSAAIACTWRTAWFIDSMLGEDNRVKRKTLREGPP
jgi:predicted restriction endonuclease